MSSCVLASNRCGGPLVGCGGLWCGGVCLVWCGGVCLVLKGVVWCGIKRFTMLSLPNSGQKLRTAALSSSRTISPSQGEEKDYMTRTVKKGKGKGELTEVYETNTTLQLQAAA